MIALYLSGAALIWDEILKMTVVKLELISDVDIYQFVERRMSGDFFYISLSYNKDNNEYISSR